MNKRDYAEFERRFAAFMAHEGLANLSTIADASGKTEPYFSWRACDCCGRRFGGDRYDCNGYIPRGNRVSDVYAVCTDCMYYAEYGRLDDATMMEVEASENK